MATGSSGFGQPSPTTPIPRETEGAGWGTPPWGGAPWGGVERQKQPRPPIGNETPRRIFMPNDHDIRRPSYRTTEWARLIAAWEKRHPHMKGRRIYGSPQDEGH